MRKKESEDNKGKLKKKSKNHILIVKENNCNSYLINKEEKSGTRTTKRNKQQLVRPSHLAVYLFWALLPGHRGRADFAVKHMCV